MLDVNNYFSKNLKYLRLQKNLSQKELGNALNKHYTTIGKWESGTRSPTLKDTFRVCKYFDIGSLQ